MTQQGHLVLNIFVLNTDSYSSTVILAKQFAHPVLRSLVWRLKALTAFFKILLEVRYVFFNIFQRGIKLVLTVQKQSNCFALKFFQGRPRQGHVSGSLHKIAIFDTFFKDVFLFFSFFEHERDYKQTLENFKFFTKRSNIFETFFRNLLAFSDQKI